MRKQDAELITNARAVILEQAPRGGRFLIWSLIAFLAFALVWIQQAEIDTITRGTGKVIPSRQLQVIQNLEGGIVSEILVNEGDIIEKNAPLLKIDDVRFSSSFRESQLQYFTLLIKVSRLEAEAKQKKFTPPKELREKYPGLVSRELELYQSRANQLAATSQILEQQASQRQSELSELFSKRRQYKESYNLANRELELTAPLIEDGAVSEVDILRLKRSVNDLEGELNSTNINIPRARSKLKEAGRKIEENRLSFLNKVRSELNEVQSEMSRLQESNIALKDRVQRTLVRSPVRGRINRLLVNTIGGVIQPGMDLVEIVPLDDSLLVEARIRPRDIGFLHPGQEAMVKFTAYDFAVYGGLKAHLEYISADSITDEQGDPFYHVRVRTKESHLKSATGNLAIIPGMLADIDVQTGKKTVLEYLLKPVLRAREYALKER
ncbi:MAG: HlyD family type I secretion periplasmic adaptor subunit [Candidatus Sedimenticola sp. (ex Thyasira tokunagai)]